MKKVKENIDKWIGKLNDRWHGLSLSKQRCYIRYFFGGYLALTLVVIANVFIDAGKNQNEIVIEHIENPTIKQRKSTVPPSDSLLRIIKKNRYGK